MAKKISVCWTSNATEFSRQARQPYNKSRSQRKGAQSSCLAANINYSTAYVPLTVSQTKCWGLVDSGATLSLCSKDLVPENCRISKRDNLEIKGVTGKNLDLLGTAMLDLKIGDFETTKLLHIVENMADNVFIIGRDLLENHSGVINYKALTFEIGGSVLPLMKGHTKCSCSNNYNLHCDKTVIIPPLCQGYISCNIKKKGQTRSYVTLTGATNLCLQNRHNNLVSENGIQNVYRGKTIIPVINMSNQTVNVYRNSKIGTFSSFHVNEINTLNNSMSTPKTASHVEPTPHTNKHSCWSTNIEELYNILKFDSLSHLSAQQLHKAKSLIAEFRDIFSESDDDIGCTDIMEQDIVLDTDVPIRDKYYNVPIALRPQA